MNSVVRLLIMFMLVAFLNPAFAQSKREKKRKLRANFGLDEGKLDRGEEVAFSDPFAKKVKNDRRQLMKPNKARVAKRPDGVHAKKKGKNRKKHRKTTEGEK